MSILCIGQAVYDITFPCNEAIIENQKYRIQDRFECMGAPAANASYLCGLWGSDTTLMARIGKDLFADVIMNSLQSVNVDTKYLFIDENSPTSLSCIISNNANGNRTILNNPMLSHHYPIDFPKKKIDVLLMDGHELDLSLHAIKHYPNAVTMLDAGTYKPEIIDLIRLVDYLVCSQDFAYQYTGITIHLNQQDTISNTFLKLKELNHQHIVITLGEQGCVYEDNHQYYHIPAFQTTAIDTTGAGDIFHGAFAYCLEQKYSIRDTIILSSMTSSISVETIGGCSSIPTLEDTLKRMRIFKNMLQK